MRIRTVFTLYDENQKPVMILALDHGKTDTWQLLPFSDVVRQSDETGYALSTALGTEQMWQQVRGLSVHVEAIQEPTSLVPLEQQQPLMKQNLASNADRQIEVRSDCSGSPNCVAEIRLVDTRDLRTYVEGHFNLSETSELKDALITAIDQHLYRIVGPA